uniref:Uncharacterized protein n=1 Tax=Arion vulgaris TaxID=1028688 RepID=A0A0B7A6P2_9EUPU
MDSAECTRHLINQNRLDVISLYMLGKIFESRSEHHEPVRSALMMILTNHCV